MRMIASSRRRVAKVFLFSNVVSCVKTPSAIVGLLASVRNALRVAMISGAPIARAIFLASSSGASSTRPAILRIPLFRLIHRLRGNDN